MLQVLKFYISSLLLIFCTHAIWAQQMFYKQFSQQNGLHDPYIQALEQDMYGYLWIGTKSALFRYDGIDFEEIEFASGHDQGVNDLFFDDLKGILWIAGRNGVTSFNGENFSFYGIPGKEEEKFCNNIVQNKDGDVFFQVGHEKVFTVSRDKLNKIDLQHGPGMLIDHLFIDAQDHVAVLFDSGIYERIGQKKEGTKSEPEYRISDKLNPTHIDAYLPGDGNDGHSVMIDSAANTLIAVEKIVLLAAEDNGSKTMWIWDDNELVEISGEGSVVHRFYQNGDGRKPPKVTSLLQDMQRNIWIGTEKGLFRYSGRLLTLLNGSDKVNQTPSSIWMINEHEAIASYFGQGVIGFDRGIIKYTGYGQEVGSQYIRHVVPTSKGIWILSSKGIANIKDGKVSTFTSENGLPHNYSFYGLQCDSVFYGATEGGLAIFSNGKITAKTTADGLLNNRLKYLSQAGDTLLMLQENGIQQYANGKITDLITTGFKSNEVLTTLLRTNQSAYWIGSDINGLVFYDGTVKYLKDKIELPFTRVRTINKLTETSIIVGTEIGLYVIEMDDKDDIHICPVGQAQGYPEFEVGMNASYEYGENIFFGTNLGILVFNPSLLPDQVGIEAVHMTGLNIAFRTTEWGTTLHNVNEWFGYPIDPVLSYDQNDLLLTFNRISLSTEGSVWYKYQLEGYDLDWSSPINDGRALYANLAPGRYNFKVCSSSDGYNWPDASMNYFFVIAPPFWKAWWFYILLSAIILVIFIMINNLRIRYRINQLIAIEKINKEEYNKIQKKVAMDFHDEIGNHLTSISMIVQLIKGSSGEIPKELSGLLMKLDIESRSMFEGTKDFIWSIDPKNDNLRAVYHRIKEFGELVFGSSRINFISKENISEKQFIRLHAGFARQISLIFKEGIVNAEKHAGCENVWFEISVSLKTFTIRLSDDGVGFDPDSTDFYKGLKKMKMRGDKIKSKLVVSSGKGQGTEIILEGNLKDI